MSQETRKSSRPSSVIRREELEAKLARRKEETEIKALRSRSKSLETVRRHELEIFEEEARRLSEFVDNIIDESDPDDNSNSNKSLEWDSDDNVTSPSFITIDSFHEVSPTVQEIIEDILNSSVSRGEEELVPSKAAAKSIRRNTSTDDNFLASSPARTQGPVHFVWPPRFPSQEPEDYSQFYYPPLQLRPQGITEAEEVFETDQEEQLVTMDPADYQIRNRVIKIAAKKAAWTKVMSN